MPSLLHLVRIRKKKTIIRKEKIRAGRSDRRRIGKGGKKKSCLGSGEEKSFSI